ncbi:methyltransferase domain-containing protein [Nocardia flavorosea]|uniref:class I SAM-dependent methyltransferase n=1 Tax=Nocardia flavorosea TaxID=53429 RepID=UPI001892DA10|nr:class I SAM-dependent methyltransferase [Nocardia flavorosea]MBF6352080.1 methyltransferase domain-containing protein [Nocardia flavorosea]
MSTETLDPVFSTYLLANRKFMEPLVSAAIAGMAIVPGSRVLDVGTGAGGALPALAATGARVEAIDLDPGVVALAGEYAEQCGVADRVSVRRADLREVPAAEAAGFDAVWAGEVIWPGNFDDPAAVTAGLAGSLKPGGVLGLFYSGYYRATFLPGHSRWERLIGAASLRRWGLPEDGPHHHDRHIGWLQAAGLTDIALTVLPRVGFGDDPEVRAYLEAVVWPEHLTSLRECGRQVGATAADLAGIEAALTPGSDRYVLDEPGYHLIHPGILATGRRPR